jgi:hypothetical protein
MEASQHAGRGKDLSNTPISGQSNTTSCLNVPSHLTLLHLVVNISLIIELSLNTFISTIPEDLGNCYNAYQLRERIKQHA